MHLKCLAQCLAQMSSVLEMCQAPTSPAPTMQPTLDCISEIQTIGYKEDIIIPSPTKEKSKAQREAITCTRSHSQKGRSRGMCTGLGIQKDRAD